MVILDLRWVLTALWLLLLLTWVFAVWWQKIRRDGVKAVNGMPVAWWAELLDQAPVGVILLRDQILHICESDRP